MTPRTKDPSDHWPLTYRTNVHSEYRPLCLIFGETLTRTKRIQTANTVVVIWKTKYQIFISRCRNNPVSSKTICTEFYVRAIPQGIYPNILFWCSTSALPKVDLHDVHGRTPCKEEFESKIYFYIEEIYLEMSPGEISGLGKKERKKEVGPICKIKV